ncbi:MAG: Uncharacterized protein G01um101431_1144 [Parcubacteria group bacterium Gr01-1014_31]|nr:MAG: Uncharacterized protein G01um101431_1144 [Parcubacteria group bacterium Gr01-1014_31]
MFLTVHAAAGVVAGTFIPNPLGAFAAGMASHFLLDRVPHYDPPIVDGTAKDGVLKNPVFRRFVAVAMFDLAIATLLTIGLAARLTPNAWVSLAAGAFGGVLPDLLFGLYRLTDSRSLRAYNTWHHNNHFNPKKYPVTFVSGMSTQLVTLAFCLFALFSPLTT